ncbi:MAG TPA: glycogen synthase [Gammaproteobacteria bacterium]|nr:glycogen synthase [Gammaproteobacteria bacterium]
MKILMVAAEYAPLAKTGGLADAVAGLSGALRERGHDVRVLLPKYPFLPPPGYSLRTAGDTGGPFEELVGERPGPRVYLLEADEFAVNTKVYAGNERDAASFMRLSRGTVELPGNVGWQADVVHCHDWHTALVPALLRARPDRRANSSGTQRAGTTRSEHVQERAPRCLLTLHNVGYQGIFPEEIIERRGYAELGALRDEAERSARTVNFLKLGIRYADALTTVSPTYAREIQLPEFGMGLEDVLRARRSDLSGILNGVDYREWSPETDPFLEPHYTRPNLDGKRRIKSALSAALDLPDDGAPLIGVVTRLVWQKGIDLLAAALPALLENTPARFALLGSGDAELEQSLADLAAHHPARVAFRRGYDEALAHRILAGADFIAVPSRYEPCGLTQLYALRYGTIPIVRATGGLADSVRAFDPGSGTGNGSVFEHADAEGLIWAVSTALGWFGDAALWPQLVNNAMQADFSWAHQAPEYEALYRQLSS